MTIYNILLFGESGAGKSTTINALVNYLRYASFEDAMAGKFMQIIPSKITLLHPITYENMVIQHGGDDPNELHNEEGASITQSPKDYLFTFDEKQYRIIDTPGMGDTRGLEIDKKNFQSIMEHLKSDPELQKLHAICFLIKTNTTRKTAFFAYCLNQLLSVLHRDACANLIFCFTFSRNSLYGPGDGYQTLKSFLQSNELVSSSTFDLKTEVNCFYIDNEAFRFLLAKKYNYPFKKNREKNYKESWDNSVAHAFKMLSLIPTLKPHDLKDTFTLIKSREWFTWLTEPLELIKERIGELSNQVEDEKENLQNFHENKHFDKIGKLNKINESKIDLIKEFQFEFHQVENFIFKLASFISLSSNVRCEKLLEQYLNLLFVSCVKPIEPNSPNAKRRKFFGFDSVPEIDANQYSFEQKLQTFNDFIRQNNQNVSTEEIQQLANDLVKMKHFSDYFAGKFGFEKQLQSQSDEKSYESEADEIETDKLESVESVSISEPTAHGSEFGDHENQDPRFVNPGTLSPRIANKGIVYPGVVDPRFVNSKILDPRFVDSRIENLVDSGIVEPVAIEPVNMKPETVKIVEPTLVPEPEFLVVEQEIVNSGITVIPEIVKIEALEPEIAGSTFIEPDNVESDTVNPTFMEHDTVEPVNMEPEFVEPEIAVARIVKPIQNEPEISQVILRRTKSPNFSLSTYENRQKSPENPIPNDKKSTKTPPLPSPRKSLNIDDIFKQSTVPQVESQPELPKEEIEEAAIKFQKTFSTKKQYFENLSFNEKHSSTNTIERPKKSNKNNIQQTEKFVSVGNVLNQKYDPIGSERFSIEKVKENQPNEQSIKNAVETRPMAPSSLPIQHNSSTLEHVRSPLNVTYFDFRNKNVYQPENVKNISINSNDSGFSENHKFNQMKSPLMSPVTPAFNNNQEYYQTFDPPNYDSVIRKPKETIIPIHFDSTDNEPKKSSQFQNQTPEAVELRKKSQQIFKNQTLETSFPEQTGQINHRTKIITNPNLNHHFGSTNQTTFESNQTERYYYQSQQPNLQNNFNSIQKRPTSLITQNSNANQIGERNPAYRNSSSDYSSYSRINNSLPFNSTQIPIQSYPSGPAVNRINFEHDTNAFRFNPDEMQKFIQKDNFEIPKFVQNAPPNLQNTQIQSPTSPLYQSIPDMISRAPTAVSEYKPAPLTNEAIMRSKPPINLLSPQSSPTKSEPKTAANYSKTNDNIPQNNLTDKQFTVKVAKQPKQQIHPQMSNQPNQSNQSNQLNQQEPNEKAPLLDPTQQNRKFADSQPKVIQNQDPVKQIPQEILKPKPEHKDQQPKSKPQPQQELRKPRTKGNPAMRNTIGKRKKKGIIDVLIDLCCCIPEDAR